MAIINILIISTQGQFLYCHRRQILMYRNGLNTERDN